MTTRTDPLGGRRDRKKQQTRTALMTAALRLVDERGLDRVTVEDISEAADVSPRTFFNYFATKDDALLGEPPTDNATVRAQLLAVPAEVPLLSAMLRVLTPAIEQMQADRDIWLLRMRVVTNNPSLLPALVARGAEAEEDSIAAIAERLGRPPGEVFPHMAAALIGAAFRAAMMRWATSDDGRPLTDFVHEALGVLAEGLGPFTPATTEEVIR